MDSGAGTWPAEDDVKRRLGITRDDDSTNADVSSALAAAIEIVTADCSDDGVPSFDAEDVPARLREAALLLTVAVYKAPDAPFGVAGIFDTAALYVAREHPAYGNLVRGFRRDFGIS